jgi:PAS domain-containing protein
MITLFILLSFNELAEGWTSDIYFHTNLEVVATLIALLVGTLSLVRFYTKKSALFLMVGIGFIGTGVLDGYHTLVTSISFKEQIPLDIQHLIPWSWFASRTFTALFFMGTAMYITEKHQPELNERYPYYFSILFLFIVVYLISTVALPDPSSLSDFYPRIAEIIPAFIYMLALIIYIIRKNNKENTFATYLAFSIVLNVLAEYPLMINSETVFDARFNIAHILKILSYLSVLVGLLDSMYKTFIDEQLSAEMIAFAETRTKEKERKLILDSVNHGLTFYDANLKLIYANKKFIDMFHVPKYLSISGISMIQIFEFIKKNYKSTPDDRRIACPENAYELALSGKDISSQCVFADEKVIAMKGCAVSNEYMITFNEVSDFVNANVESQKYSEKLSEIINTSPIGIIISCPINDSIQWINTKAVCLLGYSSAEDIIRNSLSEHWTINEPFSVIKNTQKNDKLSEILLTNKDNDKFWCYLSRDKISLDNGTFNIFWIYDITDEKEFKEQSFRNEKLASLGGLVSGVADEINTPLGICITASSLICEDLDICSNK